MLSVFLEQEAGRRSAIDLIHVLWGISQHIVRQNSTRYSSGGRGSTILSTSKSDTSYRALPGRPRKLGHIRRQGHPLS